MATSSLTKFRPGDRVRFVREILDNEPYLPQPGAIGTIIHLGSQILITFDTHPDFPALVYDPDELEHLDPSHVALCHRAKIAERNGYLIT